MAGRSVLLVMTTLPDAAVAATIARALVERRLAACVSVQPPCLSVYRWRGAVEQAQEVPLLIKTTADRYPALEATLRDMHPYEVPEIVALDTAQGLPAYIDWVFSETIDEDERNKQDDHG
ncbi:MAG: divalent-cation tolerance protein CutA [Burkholderiales bacterium]|jgi:periplasmic divalent cation tolerance protein|nr:divalent-cation tolerance protein CutA [Burkholderiales bacterium]